MKPGVYTQLYTQLVFAVKYRECLLTEPVRNEVFSYMSGLLTNKKHKTIIINGYLDHVHVFLGINPTVSISDVVADLKRSSSLFINENVDVPDPYFGLENGFSIVYKMLDQACDCISNQLQQH